MKIKSSFIHPGILPVVYMPLFCFLDHKMSIHIMAVNIDQHQPLKKDAKASQNDPM